jgi:hypothetical protein
MPDPECRKCYGVGFYLQIVDEYRKDSAGVRYGYPVGEDAVSVSCDCKDVQTGDNQCRKRSRSPKTKLLS